MPLEVENSISMLPSNLVSWSSTNYLSLYLRLDAVGLAVTSKAQQSIHLAEGLKPL